MFLKRLISFETYKNLYINLRSKGLIVTVVVASAFFLVLSSGVGATLAATGFFATTQSISTPTPTVSKSPTPTPTPTAPISSPNTQDVMRGYDGNIYAPIGSKEGIGFRWNGSQIMVMWNGQCKGGSITVKVGPPNWGYLSQPVAGIQGLGGTASSQICKSPNLGGGVGTGDAPYWKCFGFNEIWVEVSGNTSDAGLYKIPMPSNIKAQNCPAGSEKNDPNKVSENSLNQGYGTSPYNTPSPTAPVPEPAPPVPEPAPPAPEPAPSQDVLEPSSSPNPTQ